MAEARATAAAEETPRTLEETAAGAREAYIWTRCTVMVSLVIHPEDGHAKGRLISIAAWTHRDAPVTLALRRDELGALPHPLRDLLLRLKGLLPERERVVRERMRVEAEKAAKDAAESKKRKEEAEARRAQAASAKAKPIKELPKRASASATAGDAKKETVKTAAPEPAAVTAAPTEQVSLFGPTSDLAPAAASTPDEEVEDDGEGEV